MAAQSFAVANKSIHIQQPVAIGYGLHQAWIFGAMFGAPTVFNITSPTDLAPSQIMIISMAVNICTLITLGLCNEKIFPLLNRKVFTGIAASMTCIGTLIMGISYDALESTLPLSILSGVLTGIGSGILLVFWGEAMARLHSRIIMRFTAEGLAIAASIFAFLLMAPSDIATIIAAALPLGEFALVNKNTPDIYAKRYDVPIFAPLPLKRGAFVLLFGMPLLFFGLSLGFMRQTSTYRLLVERSDIHQCLMFLSGGLVAALVLYIGYRFVHRDHIDDVIRPIIPVVSLCTLFIPFAYGKEINLLAIMAVAGYLSFEALMWTILSSFSQRYRISPILIFGLGRGSLAFGSFLGIYLNGLIKMIPTYSYFGAPPFLPFALAFIVVGLALLPRQNDIRKAVQIAPASQAAADEFLLHANADGSQTSSFDTAAQKSTETAPHPISAEMPLKRPSDSLEASQPHQGIFRRKCESVSNTYLLSARETEVLFYVGRGFNAAYIQKKLYISEGTAKTHIRHIYRKTNVHSQQELMRLIEETQV